MNEAVPSFAEIISGARVIPLTKGKFAIVDWEDYDWLTSLAKWSLSGEYAFRRKERKGIGQSILMHSLLIEREVGKVIDHINRNKLDNRRSNLRCCTQSQNLMNRGANKGNSSGFKGVSFCKKDGKWAASICVNYKATNLGKFNTPEEAHAAYCEAGKRLHGEFFTAS